jgi:PAS domain S-box-containing protein
MACELTKRFRKPRSRKALRRSEALLAQAEKLANVGSWELDVETNTLRWSAQFFRMLGLLPRRSPILQGFGSDLIHPDDRDRALRDAEAVTRDGTPMDNEIRFVTSHRGVRVFHSRAIAIRDGDGRIVRVRGMSQDVTEQREAEEKLREREALLAQSEQVASLGSYQYDFETHKASLSPNLRRMLGLGPDQKWSFDWFRAHLHPDDRDRVHAIVKRAIEERTPFEYVTRYLPPDGGMRVLHVRGVPICDFAGRLLRRVGVANDITDRHEAEEKLHEREALLANAEHVANFGFWLYDVATRKMTMSRQMREMYGLKDGEEWTSASCWERVHADDRPRVREMMARAADAEKPFEFMMRFTPKGRSLRYVYVRGAPVTDSSGRVVRRAGVVQDVTEPHEAEEKLRERSAMIEYAEKVAKLGSWRYDYATDSFTLSPNMRRILGIGPDDPWTSELYWSRVHPIDRAKAQAIFERATLERKPFEFVARFAPMNGGMAHLRTRGITFCDASGKLTDRVGVVQDITEQYEVEMKMREREDLLTQAEQIANLGSWKYEFETDRLTLSPQLRQILGLGPDDEPTNEVFWSRVHPSDRARVRDLLDRSTQERKPFECVTRFVPPEGEVRHVRVRAVPVVDADGKLLRRVGVGQDITDQIDAEVQLRGLSQQLMRAQDDERRHIARELHETAGQSLAALKMTLGRLRDSMQDADDLAHALLKSAGELADAAVREVRTVSYLMHPPMLDEAGLAPALRWYARGFAERSGIRVTTEIPEKLPRQSQEIETTIFRIVQEALTNVHRYSRSSTALIRVYCKNGDICAEVRDEGRGIGFPIRTLRSAESLGVGIAGMRERVAQLKGVF